MLGLLYTYGPLIVGVDATTWNEYMGGIIQYHCGTSVNHAVQIVGYDLSGMYGTKTRASIYMFSSVWAAGWHR